MAIAIVFEYLLLAALLAPVVWLIWWGASALGDPARQGAGAAPSRAVAGKARATYSFPQPLDLNLPRRARAITVCRLNDGAEIETCGGPDAAGKCPRALADGTVPCAGTMLSLPQPIRGSAEWHIPPGYQTCLVGSYAAFRQRPSADL
jgi:hypothetical protein